MKLCELSRSLEAAVEEPALRQALSNLIEGALLRTEVGGKVEIVSTGAPAGGALIIIDDDGPDMHYMVNFCFIAEFIDVNFVLSTSYTKCEDIRSCVIVFNFDAAKYIIYNCSVQILL